MKLSILVVDTDRMVNTFMIEALRPTGYEVASALSGQEAKDLLATHSFDIVFTDLKLHDESGLDLLRHIKTIWPETVVIFITAFATVPNVVAAMKLGAFDFVIKPLTCDDLEQLIHSAHESIVSRAENQCDVNTGSKA